MGSAFLETPIEFLNGVGPERAKLLKAEAGIKTFGDLLNNFPFRYIDRSKFTKIRELRADMDYVQIKGKILKVEEIGHGKGKRSQCGGPRVGHRASATCVADKSCSRVGLR